MKGDAPFLAIFEKPKRKQYLRTAREDHRKSHTGSTAKSSFTLSSFKILNARSGARLPTTSKVDFAYFSNSKT